MAETIKLAGADGFEFAAYHEPAFTPRKGGVIVIQEIFGIDQHVRADVARWAKMGYEAIAPSLYDRRERGFTAGHDHAGCRPASPTPWATPLDQALGDIAACRDFLQTRGDKVCVVGYCYGGSLAWLAAAQGARASPPRRAITAAWSRPTPSCSPVPGDRPPWPHRSRHPGRRGRRGRRRSTIPTCRSTSTKAPATASTTRAPSATTPRPPTSPATAPSSSSTRPDQRGRDRPA